MHLDLEVGPHVVGSGPVLKTDLSRYGDTTIRDILSVDTPTGRVPA